MIHVICRLTGKNRDQLRNPTLGNRVWATSTFLYINSDLVSYRCVPDPRCALTCCEHSTRNVTEQLPGRRQSAATPVNQSDRVIQSAAADFVIVTPRRDDPAQICVASQSPLPSHDCVTRAARRALSLVINPRNSSFSVLTATNVAQKFAVN